MYAGILRGAACEVGSMKGTLEPTYSFPCVVAFSLFYPHLPDPHDQAPIARIFTREISRIE